MASSSTRKRVRERATFLLLNDFERLEEWCHLVSILFGGQTPYLVGSVMERPDFRDVDVRLILPDAVYDRWWGDRHRVRLANRAITTWGQRETGLPIDFQIQRQTDANEAYPKPYRNPMGLRAGAGWDVPSPRTGRP